MNFKLIDMHDKHKFFIDSFKVYFIFTCYWTICGHLTKKFIHFSIRQYLFKQFFLMFLKFVKFARFVKIYIKRLSRFHTGNQLVTMKEQLILFHICEHLLPLLWCLTSVCAVTAVNQVLFHRKNYTHEHKHLKYLKKNHQWTM